MSDLRGMCDLQDIVNQIFAGVIDMIKRAVNPPFFAPKTAFSDQVWSNIDLSMPGARMAFNAVSPHEPKVFRLLAPWVLLQFAMNIEREMDQGSGASAINEATRKKQDPGRRQPRSNPLDVADAGALKGRNI